MIIYCHLLNDYSGSPRVLLSTINASKDSHKMHLFVGAGMNGVLDGCDIRITKYWYRKSKYRIITLSNYLVSQALLFIRLFFQKGTSKGDIVFVNTLLPFGAIIWGYLTRKRVIVHVHEVSISPYLLRKFLTLVTSICADDLIYVSNDQLARLPINGPTSRVIYNPTDGVIQTNAECTGNYLPRRSGKFEVLMLASLKKYKGVDEFIAAALRLRHRNDIIFKLVLNANEDDVERFKEKNNCLENLIIFPTTNDPSAYYTSADVLLNLSRVDEWIETFGLTIVEALHFGVPVIVPPIGGPVEIVEDGKEGFHVDSRDVGRLVDKICLLCDTPELAVKMSRNALSRSKDFTFAEYRRNIENLLDNA